MNPISETTGTQQDITFLTALLWLLLAGFGGAVKYISTILKTPGSVSNRRFLALLLANTFISSFCGLMGGLFATLFTNDAVWHYIACGLFGYLGTQGLDIILLALRKKIGDAPQPIAATVPIPAVADPNAK